MTVSARTRTSNISASKETSSAKFKSVNTSFSRVTPVIPRCTVRSSYDPLVLGTGQVQSATLPDTTSYCKPVGHHTINVDTATCVRVQDFHEIHNFAMMAAGLRSSFHRAIEPYGVLNQMQPSGQRKQSKVASETLSYFG